MAQKKEGRKIVVLHNGLELLGFIDRVFPDLAYRAIQLSLIAPSFAVAEKILAMDNVFLNANKLRSLVKKLGKLVMPSRVEFLLADNESFNGKRVLIEVDGGRLRQRKNKRGVKPQGNKQQGFYTDWIEPKMLIIHSIDEHGERIKQEAPIVDGTTKKVTEFMELLSQYLTKIEINKASEVILIGDGAPWIWERIPKLLKQLQVAPQKITEIIDWSHAKQNLGRIIDELPAKRETA